MRAEKDALTQLRFDPEHTAAYYDGYGDRETARWREGQQAEMSFAVYSHHLRQRVGRGDRVLDAGCGPGTFTRVLLDIGAEVTCFDLSEVQLQACERLAPGASAYVRGSVTDLGRFGSRSFDVALALGGPLSYCFDQADAALAELKRVVRPGGLVGLSVMSLFGSLHRLLPGVLPIPVESNLRILHTGDLSRAVNSGHECHMFRVEELRSLLTHAGLQDAELFASGWLIPNGAPQLPEQGTDFWRFLFEAELAASAESPGAGTHILAWARVPA